MSEPVRSARFKRMQWLAVALCTAAIALNYIDRSTLAVGAVEIRKEFGLNSTAIGALQSAWSISFAFAQIPIGMLVDKLGPHILLGIALVLWSVAQAGGGLVTSFPQLLWARAGLGVMESPAYPASVRVTSNWFRARDRGAPTGVFNTGGSIGPAIAPPLLTGIMLTFGWRTMFISMGVIGLLGAIGWFLLYRDPDKAELAAEDRAYLDANAGRRGGITLKQWSRLFHFRTTWMMVIAAVGSGYGIWMYQTWLPSYLEMEHHVSVARTGFLASIPMICSILGALCGGFASDRLAKTGMNLMTSRKLPAVCGYLASAVFTAGAASVTTAGPALTFISLSLFALSFGVAAKWTLITAVTPQNYCASASSIQNFGSYVGATASPILTGYVVDVTGSFVLALAIGSAITAFAAAVYMFGVRDPIDEAELEPDLAPA